MGDASLDGLAEDGDGAVRVLGGTPHSWAGQLHRAVAYPLDCQCRAGEREPPAKRGLTQRVAPPQCNLCLDDLVPSRLQLPEDRHVGVVLEDAVARSAGDLSQQAQVHQAAIASSPAKVDLIKGPRSPPILNQIDSGL